MRILIQIDTDNAAFDTEPMSEAAIIIADAVRRLQGMPVFSEEVLYDSNGNRVGFVSVSN